MKLKFKHQDFQDDAVNAVADLFIGQEKQSATFSIASDVRDVTANILRIDDAALLANMHAIQKRNGLPLSECRVESVECRVEKAAADENLDNSTLYTLHSTLL